MHPSRDHYLPPDRQAFHAARPPTGRVVVIAPTRAACETIEMAMGLDIHTVLEAEHGAEIEALAGDGGGFGIVAGTGTGKTLGIRRIARAILGVPLRVGVVNREREATPETPSWNLVIVTTGIARRWFQAGVITGADVVVVDEIHQTSAELELCLALGKRAGCRFIWLSATVDPAFYAGYLDSTRVIETRAFDPARAARVRIQPSTVADFLDSRFLRRVVRERRGVAVFVPTRAEVEAVAGAVGAQWPALTTAFYHGGEPIRVIRPFLEGLAPKPYLLAMTAAGQSALNIAGLDTVVILDARYQNVVERGRNVLTRTPLAANDILQMAGRVHGRVRGGEVWILSDRDLAFDRLTPGPPEFQLAGDVERVAMTCAALGVNATDLELPVPLDRTAYAAALRRLEGRGIVADGRLTVYGAEVEALPVERPWAELLLHADADLVPAVAACSGVESLHRMTREERMLRGVIVPGSDHLTVYNIFAEAVNHHAAVSEVYGLARHVFADTVAEWADRRGVLVKAVEDAALGVASVYRALEMTLPATVPYADERMLRRFQDLIARIMPFDLVVDEETAAGEPVRVSRGSVCGAWGGVAGTIRYFADRFGVPRAAIEGTQLPYDLMRSYARVLAPEVQYDARHRRLPLVAVRRRNYHGFELERDVEPLETIPAELAGPARAALVEALMTGVAHHRQARTLRHTLDLLGELWRRSGGKLSGVDGSVVRAALGRRLERLGRFEDFLEADLGLSVDEFVSAEARRELEALPSFVTLAGEKCPLDYELDGGEGIVRVRLRERIARALRDDELPRLDRRVAFTLVRGKNTAVRADSLTDLRRVLTGRPPTEQARRGRARKHRRKL
ncbi:MAG TPA: DEAD/DEAH box helicase [Gemmatimonadales bacterium]|nr:DEAD/DEAH box helicase [Gemmatimonadales bacterium]